MEGEKLNSGLIFSSVGALARYGIDSYATILTKIERLVTEAGMSEMEAMDTLRDYYEKQGRWSDSKETER